MLITAAPARRAASIWRAESEQSDRRRQRDVQRAGAGPDAEVADAVGGRGGHRGGRGAVEVGRAAGRPSWRRCRSWNSGWVMSSWESTSAISGLVGVTGGGTSDGSTTAVAPGRGGGERVRRRRLRARASSGRARRSASRPAARRSAASARAPARARAPGAAGDVPGAVGAGDPRARRGRGCAPTIQPRRVGLHGRGGGVAGQGDGRRSVGPAERGGGGRRGGARRDEAAAPAASERRHRDARASCTGCDQRVARPRSRSRAPVPHGRARAPAPGGSAPRGTPPTAVEQRVEHVLRADPVAPGERAARVVEAELHAGVDVGRVADALAEREARLVDELRDDPAEHEARARRRPTRRGGRAWRRSARGAAAAAARSSAVRVSSTSPPPRAAAAAVEAGGAAARVLRGERAGVAEQRLRPALQRRVVLAGRRSRRSGTAPRRRPATACARPSPRSSAAREQPGGDLGVAGDDDEPVAAASPARAPAGRRGRPGG